jgi:hypothetical protein
MTFADIVDKFLAGSYPVPMMLLIVIVGGIIMTFLSKRMLAKLNIATKDDIEQLRAATKDDIEQLRAAPKADIEQLRAETKADIEQFRAETKADIKQLKTDIEQLREDTKHGFQQLKENDLYHTNKAILIMAKHLIADLNVYGRIKDAILENTPDRLKDDMRII